MSKLHNIERANSVVPDEKPHYELPYQDLRCCKFDLFHFCCSNC